MRSVDLCPTTKAKLCNRSVAYWAQLEIVHDLFCTCLTAKNMATWVEEVGCFSVHANHTLIVLILIEGGLMWSLEWSWLHIPLLHMNPHLQGSIPKPHHESWGKERALLAMTSRMPAKVQYCLVAVNAKATNLFNR